MVPSAPDSMRRLASAYPASKRLWKPIWSVAPVAWTSPTTSAVSSYPSAIGFSQKAGMPASMAARMRGACAGVDAAITTASGLDSRTASIRPASPPTSPATSSARRISASPTRISSTPGSPARTPAWTAPIRPAPSSPTLTPSVLDTEQRAELPLSDLEILGRVLLGDEREARVDPGVHRPALDGLGGLFDADLPHRVRVLGHGGVHVAPDDRLGCFDRPVDPDQDRIALVGRQGFDRPEGHLVVGSEDGVHVGVGLEEVLHGADRLEPVEVRGDLTDDLHVGALYGLPHSGLPLVAGDRAGDAYYEADGPFAVHLPFEVVPGLEPGREVVRADVGVLRLPLRYVRVEQYYWHLLARPLEDGLHQDRVGRRHDERVDILGQEVLDDGYLLVYGQLPGRGLHEHGGVLFPASCPRPLLGRHPEFLIQGLGNVADLHLPRQVGRRQLPAAGRGEKQDAGEERGERGQPLTHRPSRRLRPPVLLRRPARPSRRRSWRPAAHGSPGWAPPLPRRCPGGGPRPCVPPA